MPVASSCACRLWHDLAWRILGAPRRKTGVSIVKACVARLVSRSLPLVSPSQQVAPPGNSPHPTPTAPATPHHSHPIPHLPLRPLPLHQSINPASAWSADESFIHMPPAMSRSDPHHSLHRPLPLPRFSPALNSLSHLPQDPPLRQVSCFVLSPTSP